VIRAALYQRQHGYCALCHEPLTLDDSTIDHIKPVARGGTDKPFNLQLAHKSCNGRKADAYAPH
jgi:5-methylcytosine-specific restriction endonuclease McrA